MPDTLADSRRARHRRMADARSPRRLLRRNTAGVVEIQTDRPICLDLYERTRDLGRIALRSAGKTVAVGIVTMLLASSVVL